MCFRISVKNMVIVAALGIAFGLSLQAPKPWTTVDVGGGGGGQKIRLDASVLAKAHYAPLVTGINFALRAIPFSWLQWLIPLDEPSLVTMARRKAASDFGLPAAEFVEARFVDKGEGAPASFWRAGLSALLSDLDERGPNGMLPAAHRHGLAPHGRFMAQQQIVSALATQLKAAYLIDRNPEILDEQIEAPLLLTGLPRTGTTFLHRALARHADVRYLPYFEALDPVAPPNLTRIGDTDSDNRVRMTDGAMMFIGWLRPLFKYMHTMGSRVPFEEIQLCSMTFSSMLWESEFVAPSFSKWYRRVDQTPSYQFAKTLLKILQWQQRRATAREGASPPRPSRWVLKSPQHISQLQQAAKVFPDAHLVVTSRDTQAVVRSALPLLAYTLGTQSDRVDLEAHAERWMDRLEEMLAAKDAWMRAVMTSDSNEGVYGDAIELPFESYMGDAAATREALTRVLEKAGLSTDPYATRDVFAFVDDQMRPGVGSRRKFQYELSAFGLTEAQVRQRFAAYSGNGGV